MRWGRLFDDLESLWRAEKSLAFEAEVADLTRAERADVDLALRLAGARGGDVSLTLQDGSRVAGRLADATSQWLLVHVSPREHLVPVAAVAAAAGLPERVVPLDEVERRLTLGAALRVLARDRARVTVHGAAFDLTGRLGYVGADHVDVATDTGVGSVVTVPFRAILQVMSAHV